MRVAAAATARGEDLFQLLAEISPNAAPTLAARPGGADPAPLHDASADVVAARAVRAASRDWIDRVQASVEAVQAAFESALAVVAESEQARRQRKTRTSG